MTSIAPVDLDIYADDDEYVSHCLREAAIVRTRERRRCFTCRPLVGRVRRVVWNFTTNLYFDPTAAYRLTCGHDTIDV